MRKGIDKEKIKEYIRNISSIEEVQAKLELVDQSQIHDVEEVDRVRKMKFRENREAFEKWKWEL